MLVLSRKTKEAISIGGTINLRILSIKGNRVRIGIEAPQEITIRRSKTNGALPLDSESSRLGRSTDVA